MFVESADGTRTNVVPAGLQLPYYPYQDGGDRRIYLLFYAGGGNPSTVWYAKVYLTEEELAAGEANIRLAKPSNWETDPGSVMLYLAPVGGDAPRPADPMIAVSDGGTLHVVLGKGEMRGEATVDPPLLSATFHGKLVVGCGKDTKFETPECAPYRKFLP
jgi:hypothetical protein